MTTSKSHLRFLIIGGGIAGISAAIALTRRGHIVTVLEAQNEFSELGAGIQLPPNATELLNSWGLSSQLSQHATSPEEYHLRSYHGNLLSLAPFIPNIQTRYASPHVVLHRADLLALLVAEARRLNITLHTSCIVSSIDLRTRTVSTTSSRTFTADVLLGADGQKSTFRNLMHQGKDTAPIPTGRLVYRLTIESDKLAQDPVTRGLVEPAKITCWAGPGAHALCYGLDKRGVCNVVFTKADDTPYVTRNSGPQAADMAALRKGFEGWDVVLRRTLELSDHVVYWPFVRAREVDDWVGEGGRSVLVGDAAHAMLPHMIQGAAQGMEDAECLAELFDKIDTPDQIPDVLKIFQDLRQERCLKIARRAREYGQVLVYENGPYQQERDRQLKEHETFDGFPNPFLDVRLQDWLHGYNIAKAASEAWEKYKRGEWAGTTGAFRTHEGSGP